MDIEIEIVDEESGGIKQASLLHNNDRLLKSSYYPVDIQMLTNQ